MKGALPPPKRAGEVCQGRLGEGRESRGGFRGGSCSVDRYAIARWRRVGAFAVAGACAVAGLVACEGAHGALFQVEVRISGHSVS